MALRTPRVDRTRSIPAPGSACTGTRTHGTYISVREHGCTCADALDDRYRYEKLQRTGRLPAAHVDSTGTVRKLQAMNALGYGGHYLAGRLTTAGSYVLNLMRGSKDTVHRLTAGRVDELYRELSGKPAEWNPEYCPHLTDAERGWRIEKTKAAAVERGYVSPFRWGGDIDDPDARPETRGPQDSHSTAEEDTASVLAVLDSCGGDVERVRRAYGDIRGHNRGAVVGALGDRGMAAAEIAELVGTSTRQAERYLADHNRSAQPAEQPAAHVAAVAATESADDDETEDTDCVDDSDATARQSEFADEDVDAA